MPSLRWAPSAGSWAIHAGMISSWSLSRYSTEQLIPPADPGPYCYGRNLSFLSHGNTSSYNSFLIGFRMYIAFTTDIEKANAQTWFACDFILLLFFFLFLLFYEVFRSSIMQKHDYNNTGFQARSSLMYCFFFFIYMCIVHVRGWTSKILLR